MEALNNCDYVFTKLMLNKNEHNNIKYLKFYLQSYLANVGYIYIGYNEDGLITKPIECKRPAELDKV